MDYLQNILRAILTAGNPELPEFSGRDHEGPNIFIAECENVFTTANTEVNARVRLVSRALRDDVAKWWSTHRALNLAKILRAPARKVRITERNDEALS